jgi:hypothetical protein
MKKNVAEERVSKFRTYRYISRWKVMRMKKRISLWQQVSENVR